MRFKVQTKGHNDFVEVTGQVAEAVRKSGVKEGVAVVFVPGSTAAVTTIEFEVGVVEDFKQVLERIAPEDADYLHHQKWGDRNGAAHIKAGLIGPDLVVPIENGELMLGTWQQIVVVDFDEPGRERTIVVKIITGL